MKYIKRHKLVRENISANQEDSKSVKSLEERFDKLKSDISEFNMKKSNLESTVMNNKDNKDISNVVDKIINDNTFLRKYYSIVSKMKSVQNAKDRVSYYTDLLRNRRSDISMLNRLSDPEERKEQKDKLDNQIKDILEKKRGMEDKVKELDKKIADEKKELDIYMKDLEKSIKDDIKKLEITLK